MKKLLFSLILFYSFNSNANLHRLHHFPKEWTDKLIKECEPLYFEEYAEFPKQYYFLKDSDKVFFCLWKLEKAGYDYTEDLEYSWYIVEKMPKKDAEFFYLRKFEEFPEEYYLLPRGNPRVEWIDAELKKADQAAE